MNEKKLSDEQIKAFINEAHGEAAESFPPCKEDKHWLEHQSAYVVGYVSACEKLQPIVDRLRSEREKDAIDFLDFSVRNYTYDYSDSGDVWYEHGTDKKLTKEQLHTIYVNEKNGKK